MTATLDTFILPTAGNCLCGTPLATTQEINDGLCPDCADAPALVDVHPSVLVAFCMRKGRELEAQEIARTGGTDR